ncbi:MAG: CbiX/SirB N-terminal domain-containing protein [Cyanobacteria bacterium]|nr:CbiX/SirB N-terminal domain-containing protein [Cyanobacteriota bacterium]
MIVPSPRMLILLAHGSRDPRWKLPFESLLAMVKGRESTPKGYDSIALAYMEMATPTVLEVAEEAVSKGVHHFTIFPLFMAAGGHVAKDIPHLAEALRDQYQNILGFQVDVLSPIGEHPQMIEAMCQIIQDVP